MQNLQFILIAMSWTFYSCVQGRNINDFFLRNDKALENNFKVDYTEMGLDLHNTLREDHSSPPLKYDQELAAVAQATAEGMVTSDGFEGLRFGHRSDLGRFSQNVFNISDAWLATRPAFAVLWAISGWYDAEDSYDFDNPAPSSFTRLVWKASTTFGLGLARKGNDTVIVANYAPPSEETVTVENLNLFQENVLSRTSLKEILV